jgi:lysophospholipase
VILSTGRTEPIEKYGEVIGELLARGFVVLAHDWAGQGLSTRFSPDTLTHDMIGGCGLLIEDFRDLLDAQSDELPRPWVAVAHSMGAALTTLALAEGEHRFAAAVLSAPMIEFSVRPLPFWLIRLVVSGMTSVGLGPRLARSQTDPAEFPFETNVLTHDRRRYERARVLYRTHPEVRLGEPTWRWLRFAVDLCQRLRAPGLAERIACRLCVVAAGDDRVVSTAAIRRFVARVPRGSFEEVPAAFHEILMETDERRAAFWRAFDGVVSELGV